jgi:Rieske Fe-S protein
MNREVSEGTRRLIGLGTLVIAVVIVAALVFILRPRGGDSVAVPVSSVTPGSLVYYSNRGFFLVRTEDEFVALSDVEPGSGCRVTWRPDLTASGESGAFHSPCNGRTFDRRGKPLSAGEALTPLRVERTDEQVIVHPASTGGG